MVGSRSGTSSANTSVNRRSCTGSTKAGYAFRRNPFRSLLSKSGCGMAPFQVCPLSRDRDERVIISTPFGCTYAAFSRGDVSPCFNSVRDLSFRFGSSADAPGRDNPITVSIKHGAVHTTRIERFDAQIGPHMVYPQRTFSYS